MSNSDIRVVPGPANYFSHNGSLAHLHDFTATNSLPAHLDLRRRAIAGAQPFLPEAFHAVGAKSAV